MPIDHDSSAARAEILGRIRTALGDPRPSALPPVYERAARVTTRAERVERFITELETVGGHVHRLADEATAARRLSELAEQLELRDLALSDDPTVQRLAASLSDTATFEGSTDRERLFACDAGLTAAQAGIAETGTLVLRSAAERHRLVSLVPPVHLALLHADALVDGLDQALAASAADGPPERCVTLVTGPSRTSDIEMQLVIGVHGPRELHVLLIDPDTER